MKRLFFSTTYKHMVQLFVLSITVATAASMAVAQDAAQDAAPAETADDGLQGLLNRYPEADADADGKLSLDEARRFRARMWQEETEAGEPIDRTAPPEQESANPTSDATETEAVSTISEPRFGKVAYGPLPGQYFDVWLPRHAAPPCPAAVYLAWTPKGRDVPLFFIQQCLQDNMTVVLVHGRNDGDAASYFEDTAAALTFLYNRAEAYGVKAQQIGLYAEGAHAEFALHAALLSLIKGEGIQGVKRVALVDPEPLDAAENAPAPDPATGLLATAYPRVQALLDAAHNAPDAALFVSQTQGGDELLQALQSIPLKTTLRNAANEENLVHLRRQATLFLSSATE